MKLSTLIRKLQEVQNDDSLDGNDPNVYLASWINPSNHENIDLVLGVSIDNSEKVIIKSDTALDKIIDY